MVTHVFKVPVPVILCYVEKYNLSKIEAVHHFEELFKFLEICSVTQKRCAPSEAIDRVWHVFLQFAREYREFCLANFDRVINHDPSPLEENIEPYLRTREIAEQRFGKLDSSFWPVGVVGATCCGTGNISS